MARKYNRRRTLKGGDVGNETPPTAPIETSPAANNAAPMAPPAANNAAPMASPAANNAAPMAPPAAIPTDPNGSNNSPNVGASEPAEGAKNIGGARRRRRHRTVKRRHTAKRSMKRK